MDNFSTLILLLENNERMKQMFAAFCEGVGAFARDESQWQTLNKPAVR